MRCQPAQTGFVRSLRLIETRVSQLHGSEDLVFFSVGHDFQVDIFLVMIFWRRISAVAINLSWVWAPPPATPELRNKPLAIPAR